MSPYFTQTLVGRRRSPLKLHCFNDKILHLYLSRARNLEQRNMEGSMPNSAASMSLSLSTHPSEIPSPPTTDQPGAQPQPTQEDSSSQHDCIGLPSRQPRRLKSQVWNHFERLIINGENKEKCVYCKRIFLSKSKNGTSHLKDHLELRCNRKHIKVDVHQQLISINHRHGSTIRIENHVFSQDVSRKELANMVILHEYPLSIVEHIDFRRFVHSLNPVFKIISRSTLKSDILKMFVREKSNLKKLFDDHVGRAAITIDMWIASNKKKKGYMAVTSHFIDDQWILWNKTLRIGFMESTQNLLLIMHKHVLLFWMMLMWYWKEVHLVKSLILTRMDRTLTLALKIWWFKCKGICKVKRKYMELLLSLIFYAPLCFLLIANFIS